MIKSTVLQIKSEDLFVNKNVHVVVKFAEFNKFIHIIRLYMAIK
jgi:hypothetical protein